MELHCDWAHLRHHTLFKIVVNWYGRRDSNPHEHNSRDFKSLASTIPPRPLTNYSWTTSNRWGII